MVFTNSCYSKSEVMVAMRYKKSKKQICYVTFSTGDERHSKGDKINRVLQKD